MSRTELVKAKRDAMYVFPRFLIDSGELFGLFNDPKFLYMILFNQTPKGINEYSQPYYVMSDEQMADLCGMKVNSTVRAYKDLMVYDLLQEEFVDGVRRIYLLRIVDDDYGH